MATSNQHATDIDSSKPTSRHRHQRKRGPHNRHTRMIGLKTPSQQRSISTVHHPRIKARPTLLAGRHAGASSASKPRDKALVAARSNQTAHGPSKRAVATKEHMPTCAHLAKESIHPSFGHIIMIIIIIGVIIVRTQRGVSVPSFDPLIFIPCPSFVVLPTELTAPSFPEQRAIPNQSPFAASNQRPHTPF